MSVWVPRYNAPVGGAELAIAPDFVGGTQPATTLTDIPSERQGRESSREMPEA